MRLLHVPPRDGRPMLLFCHGSMATMQQYDGQLAHFVSEGYGVVAWDWLGCGESAAPEDWYAYAWAELFADVRAVFDTYCAAADAPVVAIGHSAGTGMCVQLAAALAADAAAAAEGGGAAVKTLGGLVLLAGAASMDSSAAGIFALPVFVLDWIRPMLSSGFADRALHPSTASSTKPEHVRLMARVEQANGANAMHVCKAYYRQLSWPPPEAFAGVRMPCLVVHGVADGLLPLEKGRALAEALQGCAAGGAEFHALEEASHQVMMEQTEQVNGLMAAFLAKL